MAYPKKSSTVTVMMSCAHNIHPHRTHRAQYVQIILKFDRFVMFKKHMMWKFSTLFPFPPLERIIKKKHNSWTHAQMDTHFIFAKSGDVYEWIKNSGEKQQEIKHIQKRNGAKTEEGIKIRTYSSSLVSNIIDTHTSNFFYVQHKGEKEKIKKICLIRKCVWFMLLFPVVCNLNMDK